MDVATLGAVKRKSVFRDEDLAVVVVEMDFFGWRDRRLVVPFRDVDQRPSECGRCDGWSLGGTGWVYPPEVR